MSRLSGAFSSLYRPPSRQERLTAEQEEQGPQPQARPTTPAPLPQAALQQQQPRVPTLRERNETARQKIRAREANQSALIRRDAWAKNSQKPGTPAYRMAQAQQQGIMNAATPGTPEFTARQLNRDDMNEQIAMADAMNPKGSSRSSSGGGVDGYDRGKVATELAKSGMFYGENRLEDFNTMVDRYAPPPPSAGAVAQQQHRAQSNLAGVQNDIYSLPADQRVAKAGELDQAKSALDVYRSTPPEQRTHDGLGRPLTNRGKESIPITPQIASEMVRVAANGTPLHHNTPIPQDVQGRVNATMAPYGIDGYRVMGDMMERGTLGQYDVNRPDLPRLPAQPRIDVPYGEGRGGLVTRTNGQQVVVGPGGQQVGQPVAQGAPLQGPMQTGPRPGYTPYESDFALTALGREFQATGTVPDTGADGRIAASPQFQQQQAAFNQRRAAAAQPQGRQAYAAGTTAVNPQTGQRVRWDGSNWTPVQ